MALEARSPSYFALPFRLAMLCRVSCKLMAKLRMKPYLIAAQEGAALDYAVLVVATLVNR